MKGNIKKMRRQATDWEKLFAKDISNKGGLSKIYKELLKFNNNRANNLIKRTVDSPGQDEGAQPQGLLMMMIRDLETSQRSKCCAPEKFRH